MPDFLSSLPMDGVGWIALAAFAGGLARGFAGFGTALIFLPIAAQFMQPFWAILTLTLMELLGPLPALAKARKDVDRGDLQRMLLGTVVMLPVGLFILGYVTPDLYRYGVSGLSLIMLVVLISGLRYRGAVTSRMVTGIGGAGGFLGGLVGQPGPPVIVFYMSRPLGPQIIRANVTLYLFFYDLLILGYMALFGRLEVAPAMLGLLLVIPNFLGNTLGAYLFRPEQEKLFRAVAYALIGAAALSGLPIWNTGDTHAIQ
ncbi:MAG: sulfite exporter TauE/SafE family protein [Pelagimonas sp.]|jgi:uncharacterized membrane protein YfcA|nr:sulfite exporter TauE/SafE family protein [Pelagimonas sp.]